MSVSIELIRSEDGDRELLLIDGEVEYEGHHVPVEKWVELVALCCGGDGRITTKPAIWFCRG